MINLKDIDGTTVRVNVNQIVAYKNAIIKDIACTMIYLTTGKYIKVMDLPSEIDLMIEEERETAITNIDNLLGISYKNFR